MSIHVLPLVITLGAAAAVAYSAWRLRLATKSAAWPNVTGYIVRSAYAHDNYPAQIDSYRVGIVYEYTVNDIRYTSDQMAIGRSHFLPHHSAKNIVQRYRPGGEVKVYYNPSHPSTAVLNAGQFGYALFNFAAVTIVAIVAVSAAWQKL